MGRIGRRRVGLAVLLVCLAIPLALPGGASSRVTNVILNAEGGYLAIEGSSGNDDITLRRVPGVAEPSKTFVEVHDPAGIAVVPPNCFRKDANTIHCPNELVSVVLLDLRAGDDRVRNEMDKGEVGGLPSGGGGVPLTQADGGEGDDEFEGGEGNDALEGGEGDDKLVGGGPPTAEVLGVHAAGEGPADDRLVGGPGNDRLIGQTGNDKLFGGPGKDALTGGPGRDTLACGGGRDTAVGGGGKDVAKGCEKTKAL